MGIEYKIICEAAGTLDFDAFIRRQSFFTAFDETRGLYGLCISGRPKADFPDAYASIQKNGLYFCDNLVSKDAAGIILRRIIDEALRHCQRVTIEEG